MIGAVTPFTVAETPFIDSGSTAPLDCTVTGASCAPKIVISMPGAAALWNDPALAMPVILVAPDAPTTNVTGTLMACGIEFDDSTTIIALYTPGERAAPEACTLSCAAPDPAAGEIVSHFALRLPGDTAAVHCGEAPLKFRPRVVDEAFDPAGDGFPEAEFGKES